MRAREQHQHQQYASSFFLTITYRKYKISGYSSFCISIFLFSISIFGVSVCVCMSMCANQCCIMLFTHTRTQHYENINWEEKNVGLHNTPRFWGFFHFISLCFFFSSHRHFHCDYNVLSREKENWIRFNGCVQIFVELTRRE